MYSFSNLPHLYKICVLLGARVEVYLSKEDSWLNYTEVSSISHSTPYRIVAEDEAVMKQVKDIVNKLYTKKKFHEYEYFLPNNSLKEGAIIIMQYGLGMYVQVQKDGSFKELTIETAQRILKENKQQSFYSQIVDIFQGTDN